MRRPYEILVRVREPVGSCTGYDFRPLYNRAVDLAVARIAEIRCPSGCIRFPWPSAQNWFCGDGFAVVLLNYGVMCCSPSAPVLPPAAPLPPPGPILGPQTGPFDPTDHEEISHLNPGAAVPCPGSAQLTFNGYEKVPDCASVGSFQPFVERAHARARFMFDQIACAPGCTKDPFAVSRTEWDCTGNLVHVRVFVVVTCR